MDVMELMEQMIKILIDKNYDVKVHNGLEQKNSDDDEDKFKGYEKKIREASNRQEMKYWFNQMEQMEMYFNDEVNLKKLYYIETYIRDKNQYPLIIIDLSKQRIVYLYTLDIAEKDVEVMAKKDIIEDLKNFSHQINES